MRKRIITILLIAFLFTSIIPLTVFAAGKSGTRKGYNYYRYISVYY